MNKLLSFSLYDVGNSVFPMIVIAALTSSYFVNNVVDDPQYGTALWQFTIGITGIIVASSRSAGKSILSLIHI